MGTIIDIQSLTKRYGNSRGVDNITLAVPEGTIFGFLGPNGAGKSTTINMLINLTRPTSGEVRIFGKDIQKQGLEIRRNIGFLASDMSLDGHLTGWQQLQFFGNLRGDYDASYIRELAKRLDCNLNKKIRTLSRGNRQKVGLIQALMHKPKLLILDEPTSGLDPLIQAEFNQIIAEHKKAGNTTFISSHVLSEIQELCDHVAFIRQGKLITSVTMDELTKSAPKVALVISTDKKLPAEIKKLAGVDQLQVKNSKIAFTFNGKTSELLSLLASHKIDDLTINNTDLESTFMAFYEDDNQEAED